MKQQKVVYQKNGKTGYKATRHPQPLYKPIRSLKFSIIDNLPEIPINSNEGYKLKITEKQIYVTATSSTGVYRALQTIQQLTCKR